MKYPSKNKNFAQKFGGFMRNAYLCTTIKLLILKKNMYEDKIMQKE